MNKRSYDARYREVLQQHGLPVPQQQQIEALRYVLGTDSWYMKVGASWYWYDAREGGKRGWIEAPLGPPGEW